MILAERLAALALRISNEIRDVITPRLIPSGGTLGQVLRKTSNGNYQVGWLTLPTFGSAASANTADFATAAQGALAATALQDEDVGTAAYVNLQVSATAPSNPAVNDIWIDTTGPYNLDGGIYE